MTFKTDNRRTIN